MQLVYSLRIGGSEKLALDIASHLDPRRFEFTMCAMDLDGDLGGELDHRNIPHHVMHRQGFELPIFRRLHQYIRANRFDVVHTHHFTQLFYAALPARLAGARIVHTEHEFFSYTESGIPRTLIRPLSRLCESMTVVGPEVAEYFVKTIGIPAARVTIVPNGVDVKSFDYDAGAARHELGLDRGEFIVGTIGRLEPEKDQITLLDVFRQFSAGHPQTRLMIAGDGSLAGELRAYADRIGVADRTLFLGYRRDVSKLLAAMDAFILPSIREGLPISLIEAMAARRAVVASDVGGVSDLVRDGEHGFVVAARDTAGFVAALQRLKACPELRKRFGHAGRSTVEASFSLSAMLRAYEELYMSAVTKSHVWN
jgi:glycosyltransferase involved in cell wall biosynthesis